MHRESWLCLSDEARKKAGTVKYDEPRYYLAMMTERLRFRPGLAEDVGDSLAKLNFRLFA
jgi:hypothetical protein